MSETVAPRVELELSVEFRKNYARASAEGVLRNISLTGAFLEANGAAFEEEERIKITLSVSGRIRTLNALVVWSKGSGAGIRFVPGTKRDTQLVDDLIYFVTSQKDSRRNILDNIFSQVSTTTKAA